MYVCISNCTDMYIKRVVKTDKVENILVTILCTNSIYKSRVSPLYSRYGLNVQITCVLCVRVHVDSICTSRVYFVHVCELNVFITCIRSLRPCVASICTSRVCPSVYSMYVSCVSFVSVCSLNVCIRYLLYVCVWTQYVHHVYTSCLSVYGLNKSISCIPPVCSLRSQCIPPV